MSRDDQTGPSAEGADPREAVLAEHGMPDLEGDPELQAIARFTGTLCEVPTALVSIIEPDRQRFIAREGFEGPEPPAEYSFCAHSMRGDELLEIRDTVADPRFANNPLVTGPPNVRFYAGYPLKTREGVPLGALCVIDTAARPAGLTAVQRSGLEVLAQAVMRRLAARRAARTATARAAQSAHAMREIADQLPVIVWSADGEGTFDYFNDQWSRITGHPVPKATLDWRAVVHPEDADRAFGAWADSFAKGEPFESEYRLRQFDGAWRWTLSRALPLRDRDGTVTRWYGTLTDIDSGHRAAEGRELLARELSHRIKNIFAVVASLVSLRARRRPELAAFADELTGAIRALGRAHDFVRPVEGVKGDSLMGLLRDLMAPYAVTEERVRITGHDCRIGPRAATPLALVFHELATNSAKYGSLSVEDGWIEITVDCGRDDGIAEVVWCERGGPPAAQPAAEGFGSRLLAMAVEGQLGGRFERRYLPAGLEVEIEIPTASITS